MTDKEILIKVRDKVEKLKKDLPKNRGYKRNAYNHVLSIIDSMQKELVRIKKGCKYRCLSDMQNTDTGAISFFKDKIYSAPEDNILVSEENGWLCDTSENSSNFELVEESISGLDNGDMPIERWKQAVKAASNQRYYRSSKGLTETRDDYFVDGVQWADEHPKEELVSEVLEKELDNLDNTLYDLDGVAVKGATHFLTVEDIKDIAKHFFELGKQEMRHQMMKDAIETSVCAMLDGIHIDILPKQLKGCSFGEKVKVIIIKEE